MKPTKQSFTVKISGERIDSFVSKETGESRQRVKEAILCGNLILNGKPVKASYRLKGGDLIEYTPLPPLLTTAISEDIPLEIVYEDEDLIVVNKKAGMVVHPAPGHYNGTLVNALLGLGIFKTDLGDLRPGIVHRIDKDTSGLLVVAKNATARDGLVEQFKVHSIKREYIAIILGVMPKKRGTFKTLHGRDPKNRLKFSSKVTKGKEAVTFYEVIKVFGQMASLVKVTLSTGRTHQVRVHFYDCGHSLVGDSLYKTNFHNKKVKELGTKLGRQALHAAFLGFVHPVTQKYLEFRADLPIDMAELIKNLELENE